jgi:hypothetical protein
MSKKDPAQKFVVEASEVVWTKPPSSPKDASVGSV